MTSLDLVAMLEGIAAAEKAEQRMFAVPIAEMRALAELATGGPITGVTRVSMTVDMFDRLVTRAEETAAAKLRAVLTEQTEALKSYVDLKSLEHDDPCPEDDTCECAEVRRLSAALDASIATLRPR